MLKQLETWEKAITLPVIYFVPFHWPIFKQFSLSSDIKEQDYFRVYELRPHLGDCEARPGAGQQSQHSQYKQSEVSSL